MIRVTISVNGYDIAQHTFDYKPGWLSTRVFSGADIMAEVGRANLIDADRIEIRIEETE